MPFIVTLRIDTMAQLADVPEELVTNIKMEGFVGKTTGNTRWNDNTQVRVVRGDPARYGPMINAITDKYEGTVMPYGDLSTIIGDMDTTVKASQVRAEMKNGGCLELA